MTKKATAAQRAAFGIYADCVTDAEMRTADDPVCLRLMAESLAAWRRGDKAAMNALHGQMSARAAELEADDAG
ncbi:MAG: hypothetical protein GJU72_14480 [Acidithiobacillus ferriphilus]|jgi:hypothetical protein|uniref:hypothetical protein n=1 Tax=Acidithiobacillus ferriphilus TaxID=1689834 RepID=UPI00242E926C|nr:hypothetical protein [Acidithiobacillus ferriphilus]MBW9250227.1 hypothetical protein [Acidithiobacillus ferriphilus]MBW9255335.1 hypothetical protein [Acidithiobacillus ferriphilus]